MRLRIPKKLMEALEKKAKENNVTVGDLVLIALTKILEEV